MGFTKIRAPFDGLVVAKLADAGAMAAPGVPLLIVEDPSHFRLEASLDESQIGTVRLGETVPVVLDSLGNQTIAGKVVQIVPIADPASRTFTVKIELPANPRFDRAVRPCTLPARTARVGGHPANRCFIADNCRQCTWWAKTKWPACDTSRWARLRPANRSSLRTGGW